MTFAVDMKAFAEKAKANGDIVMRNIMFGVGRRLVERSPVGDPTRWKSPPPKGYVGGRFRGNWQFNIGAAASEETGRIDPSGTVTIETNIGEVPTTGLFGRVYYYSNNVPYARALEDGHSGQAQPGFIVADTVMHFQNIVNEAVAELPK